MKRTLIALIEGYRRYLSPHLGRNCRFYPTCSAYTIEAIEKKGVAKGLLLGAWRILRCNPWNPRFGHDPVK
ncbi:MAG TPA: membrane protein insertion efficiency factor YidD [bacterium]|nr:membrane protein insertion efficiency factor YidD [bacterium]